MTLPCHRWHTGTIHTALHFSNVGTPRWPKVKGICVAHFSSIISISCAMSWLNVPFVRFPPVTSSLPCSLCQDPQRPQLRLVEADKSLVLRLTGVECLAAWPIRTQTNVKNDSVCKAVCTEKGSSASQMTAAKVIDAISRLWDWLLNKTMQFLLAQKEN